MTISIPDTPVKGILVPLTDVGGINVNVIDKLLLVVLNVSSCLAHVVLLLIMGITPSNRTLLAGAMQNSPLPTVIIEHPPPTCDPFNETEYMLDKYAFGITK